MNSTAAAPPERRSLWRSPRLLVLFVLPVALTLAAVERVGSRLGQGSLPTGEASWIWASGFAEESRPAAFYLMRDFDYPVDREGEPARLLLSVDEQYRLWVNGYCVAAGDYRPATALDQIDLGGVLQTGRNRLLLEVRSRNGAGGALAALLVGEDPAPWLVSDASWSAIARHEPGLIEGLAMPSAAEPAMIWQRPSVGRWQRPTLDPADGAVDARAAVLGEGLPEAHRWAVSIEEAEVVLRGGGARGEDLEIPTVVIDFGAPVRGELELWLAADPKRAYPLDLSLDAPPGGPVDPGRLEGGIPTPDVPVVVLVAGRHWWRDSTPREFRWVRLRGVTEVAAARVRLREDATLEKSPASPWLLGVEPRRLSVRDG